jgi:hypothetical protein
VYYYYYHNFMGNNTDNQCNNLHVVKLAIIFEAVKYNYSDQILVSGWFPVLSCQANIRAAGSVRKYFPKLSKVRYTLYFYKISI